MNRAVWSPAKARRRRALSPPNARPARSRFSTQERSAFSRTGDPAIGEFQDAVVLAQFGEVDLNALSA
jgi:hypothetical protein